MRQQWGTATCPSIFLPLSPMQRHHKILTAGAGLFAAASLVTGAMAATVFSDVPSAHWAFPSIQWAAQAGIMTGPGDRPGTFDPAGLVNRAQLATTLARQYQLQAKDINDLQVRVHLLEQKMSGMSSSMSSASVSSRSFSAYLNGGQETPAVVSTGTGQGSFTLNGNSLTYDVTVQNMSSTITAAHFHVAPPGVAGPVVMPITFNGNRASGTWTNMTVQQMNDLLAGRIYVNVHTVNHPDGEIRGQLTLGTLSSSSSSMSLSSSSSSVSSSSSSMSSSVSSSSSSL
jgi:hypothetical protein